MAEVKVYCKFCQVLLESWTAPGDSYMPRVSKCKDYGKTCRQAKKATEGNKITGKIQWWE
jgi:hypothetical protein